MSILNISGGFGLMALIKGFATDSASRMDMPVVRRQVETPVRRVRVAPMMPVVREVERFEEDCERWDGMA